jgi:hypothetical protein
MVCAMSPHIIQLPLSGSDRRHYVRKLRAAEQAHRKMPAEVAAAYGAAHALACREWNSASSSAAASLPSRRYRARIDAGFELLEVACKRCGRSELVDLPLVIWPRDKPVHTLEKPLRCQRCKEMGRRSQTNLVSLQPRRPPDTQARNARR